MIDISDFLTKRDWYSIFVADLFLLLLVGTGLISRVILWISLIVFLIVGGCSFYMAFVKKSDVSDEDFDEAMSGIKDTLFGGNKND